MRICMWCLIKITQYDNVIYSNISKNVKKRYIFLYSKQKCLFFQLLSNLLKRMKTAGDMRKIIDIPTLTLFI